MLRFISSVFWACLLLFCLATCQQNTKVSLARERLSLNEGWRFYQYDSLADADSLIYDVRPPIQNADDSKEADSKPTEAVEIVARRAVLKPYILPTANPFIADESQHFERPTGNPGADFPFVQVDFDDSRWETVRLPHDWAIAGPFMEGWDAEVTGGMGRLPSLGVAWYRRQLNIPAADADKQIYLDVEGAMSYAMVWLNGELVGGWPYGYNSWRLDLTPHLNVGESNQLAIRIDNPNHSARWYPGGGLYRNVWLTKTNKVHVAQWGTFVKTSEVSASSANINLEVKIANHSNETAAVEVATEIYAFTEAGVPADDPLLRLPQKTKYIEPGGQSTIIQEGVLVNPQLWGPLPTQQPHLYQAVTKIYQNGALADQYETSFGIRTITFDGTKGLMVNGEALEIKGVNLHHDLGALGAAFNVRAAERQMELLREMGVNALRTAHNPPAPEWLNLADRMGFLVVDEVFDCWERKKTPHDFHLIFPDWYEADIRSFVRRDKNHPSIIMWSFGNEVGEQYTEEEGAALAKKLGDIVKDEDPTRLTTASMNFAKPDMPFPAAVDLISLNYQGEGIRDAPAYAHLQGIKTSPLYPAFHEAFPKKAIVSSETAAALSSRGTYLFPVTEGISSPISDGVGGNPETAYVSAYELYTANFGSSADKVFRSQDQHPFVAGEFVWSGIDYLGEPTPYYSARSSYFGIIDLAGFKKDRFYLYQSRWRPDFPMVHILPHWNWPDREGAITPVHVFTSGDEVELFLNGESLGRKQKEKGEYRLRWDAVRYQPGELKAVAYKGGQPWAETTVATTGAPAKLRLNADRKTIAGDGVDLSFLTVEVQDEQGRWVPTAANEITFSIEGPADLVATDNGDSTDMRAFPSTQRKAFGGKALGIVRAQPGSKGIVQVRAEAEGLEMAMVELRIE